MDMTDLASMRQLPKHLLGKTVTLQAVFNMAISLHVTIIKEITIYDVKN